MRIACVIALAGCTATGDSFVLEVRAPDAPVVVVRDGDGAWERVTPGADGTALVPIRAGLYGVGALCGDASPKTASFLFDTQPRAVILPCPTSAALAPLAVRGTTAPDAEVWLDGRSVRADATGAFSTTLDEMGLHDLVALLPSTPPRIVARRALVIGGDTMVDLPPSEAVELIALYPQVTGAGDAVLGSELVTGTDRVVLGSNPAVAYVPPPDVLAPTDRVTIAARAHGCTRQHPLAAASEPLALPAPLAYTLDRSQIAWADDPAMAWTTALVEIESSTGGRYSAYASASWREATGAPAIPVVDLAALPGWTRALPSVVPGEPARARLHLSQGSADGDLTACDADIALDRW